MVTFTLCCSGPLVQGCHFPMNTTMSPPCCPIYSTLTLLSSLLSPFLTTLFILPTGETLRSRQSLSNPAQLREGQTALPCYRPEPTHRHRHKALSHCLDRGSCLTSPCDRLDLSALYLSPRGATWEVPHSSRKSPSQSCRLCRPKGKCRPTSTCRGLLHPVWRRRIGVR